MVQKIYIKVRYLDIKKICKEKFSVGLVIRKNFIDKGDLRLFFVLKNKRGGQVDQEVC